MISHITVINESGVPILVSGHKIKPGITAREPLTLLVAMLDQ